jgi:hypothetical protein
LLTGSATGERREGLVGVAAGCGAVINPEFSIAEKTPSPKWCRDCQNPEVRKTIQAQFDERKVLVKG